MLFEAGMLSSLTMLHFHLGSQVSDIENITAAVSSVARIYCDLKRSGATGLQKIDCGGGLINRQTHSSFECDGSGNYTLHEYARALVSSIAGVCNDFIVAHPCIMIESGRALLSTHAILAVERRADRRDITYCNFSLFRSIPDYVVEGRAFPVVPLQRLIGVPRQAVRIADRTGDSDGMIDRFPRGKELLSIPEPGNNGTEFIAIFDVGAYQEALGSNHNLFGRASEVDIPIEMDVADMSKLSFRPGDSVAGVLNAHGHDIIDWLKPFDKVSTYSSKP